MFEKEAEEYKESKRHKSFRADVGTVQINYESYLNNLQNAFKDGAEFGYEQGIVRLRYCCTCKKWKECKVESMYGICADWEIKE